MYRSFISNSKRLQSVLIAAFVVFAIMVVVEVSMKKLLDQYDGNLAAADKLNRIGDLKKNYDVLVLGDSRAHQGIDPEIIEKMISENTGNPTSVYNLGTPGMQAPFYYFILKKYLENHPPPKTVVLNISYYLLGGMQWFEDVYLAYYRPSLGEVYDLYRSGLLPLSGAFGWYFGTRIPSLRASSGRFRSIMHLLWNGDRKREVGMKVDEVRQVSEREKFGGYLARHEVIGEDTKFSISDSQKLHVGYSVFETYFKRFAALAKERGIQVVIFQFPWPKWYQDQESFRNTYGFYQDYIESLFAGFENVTMVDNDHFYENRYFSDPLHLNHEGAGVLSRDIAKRLGDKGALNSR